jgi:hypothetical protein
MPAALIGFASGEDLGLFLFRFFDFLFLTVVSFCHSAPFLLEQLEVESSVFPIFLNFFH